MKRQHLFLTAALIWGVPGLLVTAKGVSAYCHVARTDLCWLPIVTLTIGVAFYNMFRIIVNRYSEIILQKPEKVNILMTFPLRGWILIIFMMGLGILIKHIPHIPNEFTASFYSGLGPMLILSGLRFMLRTLSQNAEQKNI